MDEITKAWSMQVCWTGDPEDKEDVGEASQYWTVDFAGIVSAIMARISVSPKEIIADMIRKCME